MQKINLLSAAVFAIWAIVWSLMNEMANLDFNPLVIWLIVIAILNLLVAWINRDK